MVWESARAMAEASPHFRPKLRIHGLAEEALGEALHEGREAVCFHRLVRTMRSTMVRTMSEAFRAIESKAVQRVVVGYTYLLRRVLRGDAAALDGLGSMLTYGVGVEKNLRLAAACYAAASRASYAGATYNLASALIEGAGIPKDVQKGLRLLRVARRAGEAAPRTIWASAIARARA